MGGYGSGRTFWNVRPTTEQFHRLRMSDLTKEIHSRQATAPNKFEPKGIVVGVGGNEWHITLEPQDLHFGGRRWWLKCPHCGRWAGVLYFSKGGVGCRKCWRLAYPCQRESFSDRLLRRSHKLNAKLDDGYKPKRMRWTTFDRICAEIDAVELLMMYDIQRRFLKGSFA